MGSMLVSGVVAVGAAGLLASAHDDDRGASTAVEPTPQCESDEVEIVCSVGVHVCSENTGHGCQSCQKTCHVDCSSPLCSFTLCGTCLALKVRTHENSVLCAQTHRLGLCDACAHFSIIAEMDSDLCVKTQRTHDCHACHQRHCWRTNPFCGRVPSAALGAEPCKFCLIAGVNTFANSAWCAEKQRLMGCHHCNEYGCSTLDAWCPQKSYPCNENRPAPFYNAMRLRGGGGSCFINAALQALFAPAAIKGVLAKLWREMPAERRRNLLQSAKQERQPSLGGLGEPWDTTSNYEDLLAVTHRVSFADDAGMPAHSHLMNDAFYRLRQEDSDEFLRVLLEGRVHVNNGSPNLVRAMSGTLRQFLKCTNGSCSGEVPSTTENFQWLNLSVRTESGQSHTCAQGALNAMHLETVVEGLKNICPVCNRGGALDKQDWGKQYRVIEYPEVLTLVLNRWNTLHGASLHTVKANEVIYFQGRRYALASTVCHLGATPDGGHYIAVARQGPAPGEWFVYDDERCSRASPMQISTESMDYEHWGNMQSYILMYTKALEIATA
jgi:ubiquitin C-terminal hydrolase